MLSVLTLNVPVLCGIVEVSHIGIGDGRKCRPSNFEQVWQGGNEVPKYPKPGTVFCIGLDDGRHTYARIASSTRLAVYDAATRESLSVEELGKRPILFVVSCAIQFAEEKWDRVGYRELEDDEIDLPMMFSQDRKDPRLIFIGKRNV